MKSNPVFSNITTGESYYDNSSCATYKGVSIKTAFLLGIAIIFAILTSLYLPKITDLSGFIVLLVASSIVGTICVFIGRMSARSAKYCGVIYAACEGLFLGTITSLFDAYYPGIALMAVITTLVIFGVLLLLFSTGVIRVGDFFRKFAITFAISVLAIALATVIISIVKPSLFNNLGLVVFIEGVFCVYGCITLLMSFDEAKNVVSMGCDKNAEWSVALGLALTVIYIYVQVLRILFYILASKSNN